MYLSISSGEKYLTGAMLIFVSVQVPSEEASRRTLVRIATPLFGAYSLHISRESVSPMNQQLRQASSLLCLCIMLVIVSASIPLPSKKCGGNCALFVSNARGGITPSVRSFILDNGEK